MGTQLSLELDEIQVVKKVPRCSAIISECGSYRYELRRGEPLFRAHVMLNPSTADAMSDDATIRRCRSFAARDGFDGLVVVNLFAFRATEPTEMLEAHRNGVDIVGTQNDAHVVAMLKDVEQVVVGWGSQNGALGRLVASRARRVLDLLRDAGVRPLCFGQNADGCPKHPLYFGKDTALVPFEVRS